jgi:RNA-directed DNA polymerase
LSNKTTTEEGREFIAEAMSFDHDNLPETLSRLRNKLYVKAKGEPQFRFYALYDRIYREDVLAAAWHQVSSNKGSSGVDGVKIKDILDLPQGVENFLAELHEELRQKSYRPQAVRRVMIPKANGGERPLGVPTVRDRVVQKAALLILEPIFEADFLDCSHGFRPKRSAHQALEAIAQGLKRGKRAVYDADLQGYFDSIPHEKLIKCVEMRVSDRSVLNLIRMWLNVPVQDGNGPSARNSSKKGTPQGGVISPLLANIYLHWLDKQFSKSGGPAKFAGAELIRYCDDFVVLSRSIGPQITDWLEATVEDWLGLVINREKTKVINLSKPGAKLDFLGYSFRYDKSLYGSGKQRYLNYFVSDAACGRRREKVGDLLCSHTSHVPIPALIDNLNRQLVGWKNYFGEGYPKKAFRKMNNHIRIKVVKHLKRRSQRPYRPPKGVTWYQHIYRDLGLVQL